MNLNRRKIVVALAAALTAVAGTVALAQPRGAHHHHGSHHGQMKPEDCPVAGCPHGARAGEGECPMLSAGAADVSVENTKSGAVIRLSAKDPKRVADLQRAAASIAEHINAHAATGAPRPAARPSKP